MNEHPRLIRAAGGVVWRHRGGGAGNLDVALVHRPKYDDWSLPKGKLDPGELALDAAVREVREELGSTVAVSRRLSCIAYDIPDGRKEVDFWVMRHRGGDFRPSAEIDDVRWLSPDDARSVMSHDGEKKVLDGFDALPVPESVVVLVRHAKAGKRAEWQGDDNDRPLNAVGRAQARRLSSFLQHFAPDRLVAAHPLRCVQTLQPVGRDLGLEIAVDPTFSDEAFSRAPDLAVAALYALAKPNRVSVVSSQGDAIPQLIGQFARQVNSTRTKKGAAWVLGFIDSTAVSADYYPYAARRPVTAS